jgi:hypothetical protein
VQSQWIRRSTLEEEWQFSHEEGTKIADGDFHVLVLITMPITQHLIGCVSGLMVCLSRLFQIDYLGLGMFYSKAVRQARFPVLDQWPSIVDASLYH